MDRDAMLAAQRADPGRIVFVPEAFTEGQITRAIATMPRRPGRRTPTRNAAIAWLRGEAAAAAKRRATREALQAAARATAAKRAAIDALGRESAANRAARRKPKPGGKVLTPPTPRSRAGVGRTT
jgi:hypothetical protein